MNPSTIQIVKATAPVIQEHGSDITSRMYQILFDEFPEIKNIFNMTHHSTASTHSNLSAETVSPQAKALANAVYGFAYHVDQLDMLSDAIPKIVNKHVSLDIKAEHYPIVGSCILRAIKDVLKDAATDDILNAWKEAYFFLADLLISLESKAKDEFKNKPGGWDGFHSLVVTKKIKESDDMLSIHFEKPAADKDKMLPSFIPGQFLSVRFELPLETLVRNYSISNAPGQDSIRITVKKSGKVAALLHNTAIGSTVQVGVPAGDFVLHESATGPLVFIASGSGVTPMMSILESMDQGKIPKRDVYYLQYHRNVKTHPFKKEIEAIIEKQEGIFSYVCYEFGNAISTISTEILPNGKFIANHLEKLFDKHDEIKDLGNFFLVGPPSFLNLVYKEIRDVNNIPEARIHYEYFGPTQNISK